MFFIKTTTYYYYLSKEIATDNIRYLFTRGYSGLIKTYITDPVSY